MGVIGKAVRVGTGVDWDGRRSRAGATGTNKYLKTSTLVEYVS